MEREFKKTALSLPAPFDAPSEAKTATTRGELWTRAKEASQQRADGGGAGTCTGTGTGTGDSDNDNDSDILDSGAGIEGDTDADTGTDSLTVREVPEDDAEPGVYLESTLCEMFPTEAQRLQNEPLTDGDMNFVTLEPFTAEELRVGLVRVRIVPGHGAQLQLHPYALHTLYEHLTHQNADIVCNKYRYSQSDLDKITALYRQQVLASAPRLLANRKLSTQEYTEHLSEQAAQSLAEREREAHGGRRWLSSSPLPPAHYANYSRARSRSRSPQSHRPARPRARFALPSSSTSRGMQSALYEQLQFEALQMQQHQHSDRDANAFHAFTDWQATPEVQRVLLAATSDDLLL
jgi:hypothetical protein